MWLVKEPFLLRYRYPNGRFQAAMPLRAVEDTADRRAGWLCIGTEISYWATPDGRDPRELPLAERFAVDLTTAPRTWVGRDVLRVLPAREPYQVLHFWQDDQFSGWYINFESPGLWRGRVIDSRDWHLDLWITPDGRGAWKDEEEATTAVQFGHLSQQELDLARATGERILADFDALLFQVGDWRDAQPPPRAQAALALPPDWHQQ